jgi:predicted ATPase/DNA-binding SARP family transcriptional activator
MAVGTREVPESAWRLRKAKSLIKLLALAPDRRIHRERVAELLWPDRTADSAANNLHQALYVARRALEAAGADARDCLALHDDMLVLCEGRPVEIDAVRFEEATDAARREGTAEAYESALALYSGELLPEDRYEDWATGRREALRELHLAALLELAELHASVGNASAAIEALQRAVVDDPLHEEAHRRLMVLFAVAGRRQQALAQYQQLRQTLRREYEADPDPETRRVYQEVLAGALEPASPTPASAEARPPGARRGGSGSDAAARHNLPVQLTSFVGREHELAELRGRLDRVRLITLTGPGGAGKTRLALEAASERLRAYEHGVWLVELAPLSEPGLVAQETAAVLDMQLRSEEDPDAALARLIGDRRLLLLLDNCEHLVGACARLTEELLRSCPGLTILATSREPLRIGGEVTVRVPSLGLPDPRHEVSAEALMGFESVQLFALRAADAAPGFRLTDENAAQVTEVCFRLDGMPLAIELAAARTAALAPAQIAERLRDSLDLLGGGRGRLTRQQTLAATINWSHDLLDELEQVLFRRTGVFAGSFGLDAVEGVCGGNGLEDGEPLELLGRLVDKSLVAAEEERGEYRYRLLDTIRHYARERLAEAGETAMLEARHRAWFLHVAEAADPDTADRFFEPVELDLDNLRAAVASGVRDDPETALRTVMALWPVWMRRGYFTEGARLLDAALAVCPQPTPLRARALAAASALAVRLARAERVASPIDEARDIEEGLGNRRRVAAVLLYRGTVEAAQARNDQARRSLDEAFALADEMGDVLVAAETRHRQGVEAYSRGRDEEAGQLVEEGLTILEGADDPEAWVWAIATGLVADRDGRGRPRMYFEDTLLLFHETGAEALRGYMLCDYAVIARAQRDYDAAHEALDRALALHRERHDRFGAAVALNGLGNLARSREQFELGREWLEEALAIRREMGDRRATAMTLGCLGLLAGRAGDPEEGRNLIGRALAIIADTDDGPGRSGMLLNLGNLELEVGEVERALPHLEHAAELFRTQTIMRGSGWPTCTLAEALLEARRPDAVRARRLIGEARGELTEIGDERGLALVEDLQTRLDGRPSAAQAGLDAG